MVDVVEVIPEGDDADGEGSDDERCPKRTPSSH